MIECDLILHLLFVVQVEDNVVVLDGGNVWEVDAGKRVVALGAFLFTAGSGNDLAVKDDVDAMGFVAACKEETVGQVGLGIGNLQVNGFLGTGDDNRFWRILDQVGESGCGVGQGVGAMTDNKAIVLIVIFFNAGRDYQPVLWLDVGAVNVDDLHGSHFTELFDIRYETKKFF